MKTKSIATLSIPTEAGAFVAHYSELGLAALNFPSGKKPRIQTAAGTSGSIRAWHALATKAVKAVIAGQTPAELPPLDVSVGTEFQQRVWEELLWIPCGETRSYGEIARALRNPRAFRAVGGQPLFIQRGEGPFLFDVDGNRYIDYVLSWGPLITGHAHPSVVEMLLDEESVHLAGLSEFIGKPISMSADATMSPEQYDIVLM